MNFGIKIDTIDLDKALRAATLTKNDMLQIEGTGAKVLINKERTLVPVDTSATKNSIREHYTEISATRVVDEVGPETDYAMYPEYGVASKPNYPIQPYIRPAAQNPSDILKAISTAYGSLVISKWPT